jgi:hypothetical protein
LEPREPCETLESSFEHVGVFLETSETRYEHVLAGIGYKILLYTCILCLMSFWGRKRGWVVRTRGIRFGRETLTSTGELSRGEQGITDLEI